MGNNYKVRRDYSANNVPVVGYQDSADAQDVILWGVKQVTQANATTDSTGTMTVTIKPIVDVSHDFLTDGTGVARERLIDSNDITVTGGTYYIGAVDGRAGTIKLYTDSGLTTSAVNRTGLTVTYYTVVPISVDADGKINVNTGVAAGTTVIKADTLANQTDPIKAYIGPRGDYSSTESPALKVVGKDFTGYHPVCANPDTDPRTPPYDGSTTGGYYAPLAVTAFELGFNGSQWTRKRLANTFKKADWDNASGIAGASAFVGNIWTPTTGKKFRLMRVQVFNNHATVDFKGWLKDNTTGCTCDFLIPAKGNIILEFGNGLLSAAANNILSLSGYTCSAYTVSCMAYGTEE